MPYRWTDPAQTDPAPEWQLVLWPHRSLPPEGFAGFVAITFVMLLIPLVAVLGTAVLWGLLPFAMGTLWLTWALLRRSYRDGALREHLRLGPTRIELTRLAPRRPAQTWHANPYWVRVTLHEDGGPVENYVTLSGAGREVEIGAFLSPDERKTLYDDLTARILRAGQTSAAASP